MGRYRYHAFSVFTVKIHRKKTEYSGIKIIPAINFNHTFQLNIIGKTVSTFRTLYKNLLRRSNYNKETFIHNIHHHWNRKLKETKRKLIQAK